MYMSVHSVSKSNQQNNSRTRSDVLGVGGNSLDCRAKDLLDVIRAISMWKSIRCRNKKMDNERGVTIIGSLAGLILRRGCLPCATRRRLLPSGGSGGNGSTRFSCKVGLTPLVLNYAVESGSNASYSKIYEPGKDIKCESAHC
jgi:hypothetical protein